jgi:hypothetical protein
MNKIGVKYCSRIDGYELELMFYTWVINCTALLHRIEKKKRGFLVGG